MEDLEKRLKQIDTENLIWIIYFALIGLCLYSNYYEKKYFCTNDPIAKEKYRHLTIIVFIIALIVYIYFFNSNYEDIKNLKPTDSIKKKTLNELNLISSGLLVISGLIYLYIAIIDTELDIELAFN